MGFFTLELARRVGVSGRVIAVEIHPKRLDRLKRRVEKVGLLGRLDARLAQPESMNLDDMDGQAFAAVQEAPNTESFFLQIAHCLKPGGSLLLAEPAGHVKTERFEAELAVAARAGLSLVERPVFPRSRAALLKKGQ
jgi:SAM-dependent methyltransferase